MFGFLKKKGEVRRIRTEAKDDVRLNLDDLSHTCLHPLRVVSDPPEYFDQKILAFDIY